MYTTMLTTRTAPGKSDSSSAVLSRKTLQIDYINPLRSGQLYCFWMLPAAAISREVPVASIFHDSEFGARKMTEEEVQRTVLGMIAQRTTPPTEPEEGFNYVRARVTYDPPPKPEPVPLGLDVTASEPEEDTSSV